ncbi:MAG: serine/threonine protein kinase, partial [Deltaproteobacteria bacterium]|nr:serine/threonine protein kinase [Kofleriaceae bacterium]
MSSDADEADLEPLGEARPSVDVVDRAVVKARAAASLFGAATERPRVGRYHLLERVGAGGMGVVYSAYDPELDRAVAIKLVRARSARARARLLAEGKSLAQLSHPNVVPVFDVGLHGDDVYLVMELVRGQSLRGYARAHAGLAVGAQHVATSAGVIHRDFKPDNAVVGADGRVRVLDFGLAQRSDEEGDGGIAGTPRYMPPEQQAGGAITAAVDQYAFCVSLREAVGDTPGDPPPPLPRWIERIVERGTRADPAER